MVRYPNDFDEEIVRELPRRAARIFGRRRARSLLTCIGVSSHDVGGRSYYLVDHIGSYSKVEITVSLVGMMKFKTISLPIYNDIR